MFKGSCRSLNDIEIVNPRPVPKPNSALRFIQGPSSRRKTESVKQFMKHYRHKVILTGGCVSVCSVIPHAFPVSECCLNVGYPRVQIAAYKFIGKCVWQPELPCHSGNPPKVLRSCAPERSRTLKLSKFRVYPDCHG